MTNFERLLPYLQQVIRNGRLNDEAASDVHAFRLEPAFQRLPRTSDEALGSGNQALFLLRLAADALERVAHEDQEGALEAAREAKGLPLSPEPFEGVLDLFAARLAERVGDRDARVLFEGRYRDYRDRFSQLEALRGLDSLIADPYVSSVLESALEASAPAERQEGANMDYIPFSWTTLAPQTALYPFNTSEETSARTYIVLVRKLTDPVVAAFAIFEATLADITDGGDYGLRNEKGELYADLLLDFDEDALELLKSLDPDRLALRFVFQHSDVFETFAAEAGSLFDIEISPEEKRLYFKICIPHAWEAAQVPLHGVWSNLESCVVLSEGA